MGVGAVFQPLTRHISIFMVATRRHALRSDESDKGIQGAAGSWERTFPATLSQVHVRRSAILTSSLHMYVGTNVVMHREGCGGCSFFLTGLFKFAT